MTTAPAVFSDSGYVTVYTVDLPATGDLTLTGTITTDGDLGALTRADILGWDLTVYSASLAAGFEFTPLTSTLTMYSDGGRDPYVAIATATTLTLPSTDYHKTLKGGSGYDFLIAGPNDTLIAGPGNETFVFNQGFGNETVANFNPNQDQLAFNKALFAQSTASFVLSQTHDTGFGAQIVVDPHDTVTLTNVTVAQLQAAQTTNQNLIHFF
jgi:hypothetical protein